MKSEASHILSDRALAPKGPYSQGVVSNGLLFVSGQAPFDPATGELVVGGIREQTARALENLLLIAEATGATAADAVRIGAFLADPNDFPAFNDVYARYFSRPYPGRTTVGASLLGFLVEVDGVFAVPA